ncbi:MAG: thioredoxin domain-containing protein [Chloroflexi bacterium]|nr:thioredoxin domain-containing protein [Chloroflexota bacterium]
MAQLEADFPDDLRVIYRHFPLLTTPDGEVFHDKAAEGVQAAEAAGLQGKFWEMHDLLFETQSEWSGFSEEEFVTWVFDQAETLELDVEQFEADYNSETIAAIPQEAYDFAIETGIPGTPFLLIDGRIYSGPRGYLNLSTIIELQLLAQRHFTECPPMTVDATKEYIATIATEKGDVVVELFPDVAPIAVNSFIFLAENDWFDGVTFHRVLPGFVAQAGDPTGTGAGGPGYFFSIETSSALGFDRAGLLAMANSGPTANGSQFFVTMGPATHLNGGFTIFGEVLEGMEVVESLTPRDPEQEPFADPGDLIVDVTVEER